MGFAPRVLAAALLCALVLGADVASADVRCVAPVTCGANQSPTLDAALALALGGDTIQVGDLTLNGPVTVPPDVHVEGPVGAPATLTFDNIAAGPALTITSGATASPLRIALPSGSATSVRLAGGGLWHSRVPAPVAVDAPGSRIQNSLVRSTGTGNAIEVGALGGLTLRNATVVG